MGFGGDSYYLDSMQHIRRLHPIRLEFKRFMHFESKFGNGKWQHFSGRCTVGVAADLSSHNLKTSITLPVQNRNLKVKYHSEANEPGNMYKNHQAHSDVVASLTDLATLPFFDN